MTPELAKVGKVLAGGNVKSVCKAIFANPHLRKEAIMRVSKIIDEECRSLCAKRVQPVSLFRCMTLEQAESFLWTDTISELETKSPTLYNILTFVVTHSAGRNKQKKGDIQYPGLCTAVAILLKERNREMTGIQSYISSALFSSGIHKKVRMCAYCLYKTYVYNASVFM